jgi:hypothetical protein
MKQIAIILITLSAAATAIAQPAGQSQASGFELKLWYQFPACIWEEALPVSNGRIGAMIYGGVHREHIQLSEETILVRNLEAGKPQTLVYYGTSLSGGHWSKQAAEVLKSRFGNLITVHNRAKALCHVDPATGLNAAQWFARHFV